MALVVERICASRPGELVGTVGKFAVAGGGATNVIPGCVDFTVDLRSGSDGARTAALPELERAFREIAAHRKVGLDWDPFFELFSAPCNRAQQDALAKSIEAHGIEVLRLPSGAGHDAMELARIAPMAMLFVRCGNGGISHNPLEIMTAEDAETATSVLLHFLENLKP
jgi:allantoate deiminase